MNGDHAANAPKHTKTKISCSKPGVLKKVFSKLYGHLHEEARLSGDVRGLRLYVEKENEKAIATYRKVGMHEPYYRMFELEFKDS